MSVYVFGCGLGFVVRLRVLLLWLDVLVALLACWFCW